MRKLLNVDAPDLTSILVNLEKGAGPCAMTLGDNSRGWRQFLGIQPESCFTLTGLDGLSDLKTYLGEHTNFLIVGYLSYDLGNLLKGVPQAGSTPLAEFMAFPNWLELTPDGLEATYRDPDFLSSLDGLAINNSAGLPELELTLSMHSEEYRRSIGKIHDYIRAGDIYQANFTQQLRGHTEMPSRDLYRALHQRHPAACAAYLETRMGMLHSLSPELFVHLNGDIIRTQPIKGTRPRGANPAEDESNCRDLIDSTKEQAELAMITDLLRNDLGEICQIGSVKVDASHTLLKLPRVWHTYSDVSGALNPGTTPLDAILSMFPGGSITGCPKLRAMEIIAELETEPRGIYTGSIGYFHPDGEVAFNIAIRTLIQHDRQLSLGIGGGITIASDWESEWDESLIKAAAFQKMDDTTNA
jgi:anthranilate/para-aminobenzoate synthase component I